MHFQFLYYEVLSLKHLKSSVLKKKKKKSSELFTPMM